MSIFFELVDPQPSVFAIVSGGKSSIVAIAAVVGSSGDVRINERAPFYVLLFNNFSFRFFT